MLRIKASLLLAPIVCVSCSGPAIAPSQSLVGASDLPSAEALSRETLYITRGANDWGGDRLSYELRPGRTLIVTHSYYGPTPPEVERGKETLDVSPEIAAQVRQLLWRVRPGKLEGQGLDKAEARPAGCERRGPHDFGEVAIAFINEGDAARTDDNQIGLFELPTPRSCNTPAAIEARAIVWRALRLLPRSQVVAGFERTS